VISEKLNATNNFVGMWSDRTVAGFANLIIRFTAL